MGKEMTYRDEISESLPARRVRTATAVSQTVPPAPNPLILKFQTGRGRYAYDAHTGAILKLDRVCFELLDFIESGPKCKVPPEIAKSFPPQEIAESLSRLELLLNKSAVFHPVSVNSRLASPDFIAQNLDRIVGRFDQLILEVTQNCNLRCRYCVYSGRHAGMRAHNDLAMPWDVARKAIDFFLKNPSHQSPHQTISFYGGETILNMGLVRSCVEYVRPRDQNITFGLTTNGTLLNGEVARFLVDHDFTLYVSLDGPGAIHDKSRVFAGGGGTFEVISRNLRELKDLSPEYYKKRVVILCTISPDVDFNKLLDFFANTSSVIGETTPIIGLEIAGAGDSASASQLAEFRNGLTALEDKYLQKLAREDRGDTEFAILRGMFERPYMAIHRRTVRPKGRARRFHTSGMCFPGNFRLFVRSDGTYVPCVKANNALEIGNVEHGLDGIKICDIYRAYHDLHQNECRTCWAMNLCVNCVSMDTKRTGRFEAGLYPSQCEEERDYWKEKLTKYTSVLEDNPRAFDHLHEVTVLQSRVPLLDDLEDLEVSTPSSSGSSALPHDALVGLSEPPA